MAIRIDKVQAEALLRDAVNEAELRMGGGSTPVFVRQGVPSTLPTVEQERVFSEWVAKIEQLSRLCETGGAKTHIAFVGTAIVAKAVCPVVDLMAIKPHHAPGNPYAFSARSLCHGVLVPLASELGLHLGTTGREPLNNQPYFRMTSLGDRTPVRKTARPAFAYTLSLVKELSEFDTTDKARVALVAYVSVRRMRQPQYVDQQPAGRMDSGRLVDAICALVGDESEHGRRAQAVVAGLMDAFAGSDRVDSGRINDPSRNHPGDVCVRDVNDLSAWGKAFEVRDKPVSVADIRLFAQKCADMGVHKAGVVAVSDRQAAVGRNAIASMVDTLGVEVTVFTAWRSLVDQVLLWSEDSPPTVLSNAVGRIHARLIALEASEDAVSLWVELTRSPPAASGLL